MQNDNGPLELSLRHVCSMYRTATVRISEPLYEKTVFCICENKDADQLRGNREADQRLCFRYTIVQSLYFLNPKFEASRHILWLYSQICVKTGRKPQRPVFLQRGSFILIYY